THKPDVAAQPSALLHGEAQSSMAARSPVHPPTPIAIPANTHPSSERQVTELRTVAEVMSVDPAPEDAKSPAPAREIRLEVAAAEQRVEVRLVDRGGEGRAAGHTPDS